MSWQNNVFWHQKRTFNTQKLCPLSCTLWAIIKQRNKSLKKWGQANHTHPPLSKWLHVCVCLLFLRDKIAAISVWPASCLRTDMCVNTVWTLGGGKWTEQDVWSATSYIMSLTSSLNIRIPTVYMHTRSLGNAYKGVPCTGGHTPGYVPVWDFCC